jgi:DNA-binding LytR/AlgR family response regulator
MKNLQPHLFDDKISLNTANGIEIFNIADIIYCFIENREVEIVLLNGQTTKVLHSISYLESIFSPFDFYRCHAKNVINFAHVRLYNHKTGSHRLSNNIELKVACDRKVKFKQLIYSLLPPPSHTQIEIAA